MANRRLNWLTALATGVVMAILSLLTMNHTVGFIDSGELAAAAATLGVPHPTGYPLLMILGHVATVLLPGRDIMALNILNAILFGIGSGVMTLLFSRILRTSFGEEKEDWKVPVIAASAALLVAMTTVWWGQGTGFEAYGLHALLLPLVMLTFLIYLEQEGSRNKVTSLMPTRSGWLFSLVLGLAFANHMTTIILAPAFLYLFFRTFGFSSGAFRRIVALIPGFLLGLLPYLYIPIRAAANPPVNWGRTTTFSRFLNHITGEQFRDFMFQFQVLGDQLGWYFAHLPSEFLYIGLLLALVGVVTLVQRSRPLGIFTALLFLFCLFYSGTYAIKEIEPYFMTATLAVGIWVMYGLWEIVRRFGGIAGAAAGLVMVLLSGLLHYSAVDQSDNTMVEDLARNIMNPLPENAVLLTTRWDIFLAGTMYLQYAEGFRPDVSVINVNMLHDRAYLSQVLEQNPEFKRVDTRIREFVNQRKKVDQGLAQTRKDSLEYSRRFYRMLNGIIKASKRPTFVTWEVDTLVGYGLRKPPVGLAYGLTVDTTYLNLKPLRYTYRLPENRMNPDVMSAAIFYARAELARAEYDRKFGNEEQSRFHTERAGTFDPGIDPEDIPSLPMGNSEYLKEGAEFFQRLRGK